MYLALFLEIAAKKKWLLEKDTLQLNLEIMDVKGPINLIFIYVFQKTKLKKITCICIKVEIALPSQKEARILQITKEESLSSFQWCLLQIAHN